MKLLIAPFAKNLKVKKKNAKNYPWWPEFIELIRDKYPNITICQVGSSLDPILPGIDERFFDKKFLELCSKIKKSDIWVSVDTYFHHVATYVKNPGVVIWSQSNPKHFGDPMHTNLFKDEKYFRQEQYHYWDMTNYEEEAFVDPQVVVDAVVKRIPKQDL